MSKRALVHAISMCLGIVAATGCNVKVKQSASGDGGVEIEVEQADGQKAVSAKVTVEGQPVVSTEVVTPVTPSTPAAPGAGSVGVGVSAEAEPNNGPEAANPVQFGKPFTTAIQKKGDSDWFKVSPTAQGYIRVRVKDVPRGLGIQVRFCTYDEWDGIKELRHWHKVPDAFRVVAGVYYIHMIDDFNDRASPEQFTVMVDFLPEMDSLEPNDGAKSAARVEPGSVIAPAIYPLGDSDWFKVKAPDTGYLMVKASGVPGDLKPEVRFVTLDDFGEASTELRHWHKIPDACRVARGDTCIQLIDDFNDRYSEKPFKLKIEYLEEFDPGEPNNSMKEATPMESGATRKAAIFPLGDSDWFRIACPGQGYVEMKAAGAKDGVQPEVRFCLLEEDGEEKELRHWHRVPFGCAVGEGDVYVQMIDDFNDRFSQGLFDLRAEFIPEFDPGEPNNNIADAKPLEADAPATMAIFPVGDVDYFKIEVAKAGKFKVSTPRVAGLAIEGSLRDKDGKQIGGWSRLPHEYAVEAPGTYYLAVIDDFNDLCSRETFDIKIEGDALPPPPMVTVPDVVGKALYDAAVALRNVQLRSSPTPSPQRRTWKVTAQSPAAGAAVPRGARITLTVQTPQIEMPNFVGMPEDAAKRRLRAAKLRLSSIKHVIRPGGRLGKVVEQQPPAGTTVSVNSGVSLTISKRVSLPKPQTTPKPQMTQVPNVVGIVENQAGDALRKAGLKVVMEKQAWHREIPRDHIVSQNPAAGASVAPGSEVRLVVSSGPPAVVPPVMGQPLRNALQIIARAELRVGKITYTGKLRAIKKVVGQQPAGGTRVDRQSAVNLRVDGRK